MHVGQPIWSVDDLHLVALARRGASIVSTKFLPPAPNSQAVRTIAWRGAAAATWLLARELRAAVAPTRAGRVGLDVSGSALGAPSKT